MDKSRIMQAAWQIFRETYHYPAVPFKSIGRPCFGWALSEAYRREREKARIAAIPASVKTARITYLQAERERAAFIDSWQQKQGCIAEINRELSALVAA
jgi:hypothetical protein